MCEIVFALNQKHIFTFSKIKIFEILKLTLKLKNLIKKTLKLSYKYDIGNGFSGIFHGRQCSTVN